MVDFLFQDYQIFFQFFPDVKEIAHFRETDGSIVFSHVEQYMHAAKALIFQDFEIFYKVCLMSM